MVSVSICVWSMYVSIYVCGLWYVRHVVNAEVEEVWLITTTVYISMYVCGLCMSVCLSLCGLSVYVGGLYISIWVVCPSVVC